MSQKVLNNYDQMSNHAALKNLTPLIKDEYKEDYKTALKNHNMSRHFYKESKELADKAKTDIPEKR